MVDNYYNSLKIISFFYVIFLSFFYIFLFHIISYIYNLKCYSIMYLLNINFSKPHYIVKWEVKWPVKRMLMEKKIEVCQMERKGSRKYLNEKKSNEKEKTWMKKR